MISTEEIVRNTGGVLLNGDMGISFSGVTQDSRQVRPGDLFVAIKGPRFDGHEFVLDAISSGAKGALVAYWPENINIFELHRAIAIIKVQDTLKALGDLAAYFRRKRAAKVVGIAGSCGKTTTKEFLASLISGKVKVHKSPGNWNNLIGLPLTILNAKEEAGVWVLELGTNMPGEIPRLTEIAAPDVSLLLGVSPEHLEGLGSLEDVFNEEIAIFAKAPNGYWVYPADQEEISQWVAENATCPTISFGFSEKADLKAEDVKLTREGTYFKLSFQGKSYEAFLPLFGKHFVFDALAALAAAKALGFEIDALIPRLKELKGVPKRLELQKIANFYVLNDTYNANPASFAAACEVLKALRGEFAKVLAVVGDMKELGPDSPKFHEEVGKLLAEVCDEVLAVGEFAKAYARGGEKIQVHPDKASLMEALKKKIVENALILVKGSRSMAMEEIVSQLEKEVT